MFGLIFFAVKVVFLVAFPFTQILGISQGSLALVLRRWMVSFDIGIHEAKMTGPLSFIER